MRPMASQCIRRKARSLSPPARTNLELHWTVKPVTPQLSYDRAVAAYKSEYARRYQALMHGEPPAKP